MPDAKQPTPPILKLANFFGVFGYMGLLLEWLWVGGLIVYPFVKDGKLDWLLPDTAPAPAPSPVAPQPADGATITIGIIVTIVCLALAAYAVYALPRTVGKAGAKAAHTVANAVVPAITHHQPLSKKKRLALTFRVTLLLKAAAIALPLAIVLVAPSFRGLQKDVVVWTALTVAAWSLLNFAIQLATVKAARLPVSRAW